MRSVIPIPLPEPGERLPLTKRQQEVLAIITAWHAVNGTWPTIRELSRAVEPPVYVNAMRGVVDVLRRKSYLAHYGECAMEILS